jgi:hypothetical protein
MCRCIDRVSDDSRMLGVWNGEKWVGSVSLRCDGQTVTKTKFAENGTTVLAQVTMAV